MKYSELGSLTIENLRSKKSELHSELMNLRMKNSIGQVANPLSLRRLRRDVARIFTAIKKIENGAGVK